ncbi:MAG: hypothetical protein LBR10_07570 [Prevotellaceae bacterium]|jgi:hypothetical protein|nr:hypothetical protein [Prevotellaceae bacterium]
MKHLFYLLIALVLLPFSGCEEDINIVIPEEYQIAEITGIAVYNENLAFVNSTASIDDENKTVEVTLSALQDITKIKVTLTISPGATVKTPLGTGLLDFTEPKTVIIASPGEEIENTWTIAIINPS